jgi:hypothetical protein
VRGGWCFPWGGRGRIGWLSAVSRGAQDPSDAGIAASDAAGGESVRGKGLSPGAAEVVGEGAGETELGVCGGDQPDPAVGLDGMA